MTYLQLLNSMSIDFINAWCASVSPFPTSNVKIEDLRKSSQDDFLAFCGYPS